MRSIVTGAVASLVVVAGLAVAPAAVAAPASTDRTAEVVDHWTPERLAAAQPRDLLVDERGLGYERRADGRLAPHGHRTEATSSTPTRSQPTPQGRPSGGGDTAGPTITGMTPAANATIGPVHTFSAVVTDPSTVSRVTFLLTEPDRRTTTYSTTSTGSTYTSPMQNLAPGKWSWTVQATDGVGNVRTSSKLAVTVSAKAPGDSPITANAGWSGGTVQSAAGRIFFEMPADSTREVWEGYVCSGTVVTEPADDRSIILTAAHCVFDDVNQVFARNVLFIPDQAGTTGLEGTDRDCSNDTYGCWVPSYGLVDTDWTTRTFPANIAWDYAYYVVPTTGAHVAGRTTTSNSLEEAVGTLRPDFTSPEVNLSGQKADFTHALGYSYSDDPHFMFCSEDMTVEGADNWWLPNCGLSGGASGGPWLQPVEAGSGPVISVNSWGYTNRPGMAGPKLSGTSAEALFVASQTGAADVAGGSAVPVN